MSESKCIAHQAMCNVLQHVKMDEMPRNNVQAAMQAESNSFYTHIHFLNLHDAEELVKIHRFYDECLCLLKIENYNGNTE